RVDTGVSRRVHLPAGRAEVDAAGIERVDGHRVAEHVDVAVLLRQAPGERLPVVSARPAAVDAQLAFWRGVLCGARGRGPVDGVRVVGVNVDGETEVRRQVAADLVPRLAGVVAAHDVPVLLHVQHVRPREVHREPVHAVPDLGVGVGYAFGPQATVHRLPRFARVIG